MKTTTIIILAIFILTSCSNNQGQTDKTASTNESEYLKKGIAKAKLQNYQTAIGDYSKAAADDYVGIYRELVKSNTQQDYQEAIEDFNKAIGINPKYADAYFYRGFVRALLTMKVKDKNATEILKDFNKAIEINPKLHRCLFL